MITAEQFGDFYSQFVEFDRHLGMTLEVLELGKAKYTLAVKPQHLTSPDNCHGGVMAAMMDATLGVTALSYAAGQGNLCATVEFKINYLSPVHPGDILVGEGKMDFAGSKIIVTSADISEEKSQRLVAKGIGTFSQYPASKKAEFIKHLTGEK